MARHTLYILSVMLLAFCFAGCDDDSDGDYYPSLLTDFVTAETDNKGIVSKVTFDDGAMYNVTKQSISSDMPDTTLRCLAIYTKEGAVYDFYQLKLVFSDEARPADQFKDRSAAPVKMVSQWKSGKYVNMHLGLMTTGNGKHGYGFCIDSVVSKTTYVSLLHKRPEGDAESYTQDIYMSLPLTMATDSVCFSINTYDGMVSREYYIK